MVRPSQSPWPPYLHLHHHEETHRFLTTAYSCFQSFEFEFLAGSTRKTDSWSGNSARVHARYSFAVARILCVEIPGPEDQETKTTGKAERSNGSRSLVSSRFILPAACGRTDQQQDVINDLDESSDNQGPSESGE